MNQKTPIDRAQELLFHSEILNPSQSMPIEIDVVIPTYNRASLIPRALESILAQTYPVKSIWVIDDGSDDDTFTALSNYLALDKIKYVRLARSGVSHARNMGVGLSTSPWVAFLDSDDEWLPNKLELQFKLLTDQPELKLIHGEEVWIRNGIRVNAHKKHQKFGGYIFEKCLPLCLISPSATIMQKSTLLELGGFREDYPVCEDYDLWLRFCSRYPVGFVTMPIIRKYGGHDDQLSRKYFAMDYWRVKSLYDSLSFSHLNYCQKQKITRLIISKSQILIDGYIKHDNLTNLSEIEEIYRNVASITGFTTKFENFSPDLQ